MDLAKAPVNETGIFLTTSSIPIIPYASEVAATFLSAFIRCWRWGEYPFSSIRIVFYRSTTPLIGRSIACGLTRVSYLGCRTGLLSSMPAYVRKFSRSCKYSAENSGWIVYLSPASFLTFMNTLERSSGKKLEKSSASLSQQQCRSVRIITS